MAPTPKEMDLGGDTWIVVGSQSAKVRIKVCPPLLKLVSPYFRALLGPHFKEAVDSAGGKDIEVQDDQPESFALLCIILHMKYVLPQKPLAVENILQLAIATDKYSCTQAIAHTVEALVPESVSGLIFTDGIRLVIAAYLFDHPKLFQRYTEGMILHHTPPLTQAVKSPFANRLPAVAWCKLRSNSQMSSG